MCMEIRNCIADIYREADDEREKYIAAGVCSDCGACSLYEAAKKCKPQQTQSGEWSCAGNDLWQGEDADDDCPNVADETRRE